VSPEGRIGLYARSGNHEVVDIPNCRVLAPVLADVAATLRELVANPPAEARALLLPYNPFGGGVLRALDLREVRMSAQSALTDAEAPISRPAAVADRSADAPPPSRRPRILDVAPTGEIARDPAMPPSARGDGAAAPSSRSDAAPISAATVEAVGPA